MKSKDRKPAPFKPALPDTTIKDKGVVVSLARYRWKIRHADDRTEAQIRMLRFIWMRDLKWEDRGALHGGVLGALLRADLVQREYGGLLKLTNAGAQILETDRKARRAS